MTRARKGSEYFIRNAALSRAFSMHLTRDEHDHKDKDDAFGLSIVHANPCKSTSPPAPSGPFQ